MPWYVLECENGYLGNEFELYNGTARRPRLAVVDLQEASLFAKTKSAKEFSLFMASAEERGRRAGERFKEQLALVDPRSSLIFGRIALEEVAHIELAMAYFPEEAEMMRVKAPTYAPKLAP